MKATAVVCSEAPSLGQSRIADYIALTKPRIAVLVLFTVAVGVVLGSGAPVNLMLLLHTVIGTAFVAGGASALNQLLERQSDARMKRTAQRPLPAQRLQPLEVLVFGVLLGAGGLLYLSWTLQQAIAPLIALLTFVTYVGIYTPLKSVTSLNTFIGAIPGALPPVIGWTAARGQLDREAIALFLIVLVWQIPHFMAIAWIYREDYRQADLQMVPVNDPTGKRTGWTMVLFAAALIPVALSPSVFGRVGPIYLLGSAVLGIGFLLASIGFLRNHNEETARSVLRASLIYLPGLLALLVLDGLARPMALAAGF